MDVEFDPGKDAANIVNHSVSLRAGRVVLENMAGEEQDSRSCGGEVRMRAFGLVQGRMFCCVYTMRGGVHRIIPVRVASRREVREWLRST